MNIEQAFERLRDDWAVGKDEDWREGDEGPRRWVVHGVSNGEYYRRLGSGETIVEAIEAAEAYVAQEEREQAERDADYERRKAAGLLTPAEKAGASFPQIWSEQVLKMASEPTMLFGMVNRAYEGEIAETGDVVSFETFQESTVSTDGGNVENLET